MNFKFHPAHLLKTSPASDYFWQSHLRISNNFQLEYGPSQREYHSMNPNPILHAGKTSAGKSIERSIFACLAVVMLAGALVNESIAADTGKLTNKGVQNSNDKKAKEKSVKGTMTVHEFSAKSLSGDPVNLSSYKGKVLVIVNTASKCGFTPQYEGLQKLYAKYKDKGLTVLGFPCNQFGAQEPGPESEIATFCQKNYGVDFPMFEKIDVNGDSAHPLYKFLTSEAPGALNTEAIKWNFTKFLVDKDGHVVKRFAPNVSPQDLEPEIEKLL